MSLSKRDIKKDKCNVLYVGHIKTKPYDSNSESGKSTINLSEGQPKQNKIKKI